MSLNCFRFSHRVLLKAGRLLYSPACTGCFVTQGKRWFGQPAAQTHPHLVQQGEVTPGITQEEYRGRRQRLMEQIQQQWPGGSVANHLVIVPSAPRVYMTHDIPYPFRQNTDFLYLCGFQEPDSILILESGNRNSTEYSSTLFVPRKDPNKELWEGPRSGMNGAVELTGVDSAYNIGTFESYLQGYLHDHDSFVTWYDFKKPAHCDFHQKHISEFLTESGQSGSVENVRPLVQRLRLLKSDAEVKLMQKTCDVASNAFREVMKFSHPGVNEAHLYGKMDFECKLNGADFLAYPPVVAGGNRANTIHYVSNNQLIKDGEMVLMDAGCECHGYTSDITRTWPVTGEFSAVQRALYEAVLEVQETCIRLCADDSMSLELVFLEMLTSLGRQLQRLGIIPLDVQGLSLQRAAREFCPHHVGHYLGMDVHDTDGVSRSIRLQPGMVITIEPGLYIQHSRTDVSKEFRGQGIRIEDDVLITADGPLVLSASCPKHPEDIQTALAQSA